ncbi:hypothetical protein [Staphylococcus pseudintermedius]|uniref:hypothetical protein n=1 Tax=Staphylococcus pseudintermedius TaxID=283734 RepID=UPI00155AD38E|nr:hypothetical protein [Staphylococcus pseudintermedius]EHT3419369.1 hypothetical protein [Staphylococcus pseudintermedius]EJA1961119.1 hypothetical protein [Staphylococcus pseudintermedius]EJD8520260.1 hypothetical protein [Staphylococcus pseudintermedius]EJG5440988.1 hypothetical protein [Staphylococcus pseudintermedius]ELH0928811.1 hypothetical protein [Staphylococcus pseudintermedius]
MVFECKKGPLNVKIDIKKTSIKECIKGIVFWSIIISLVAYSRKKNKKDVSK